MISSSAIVKYFFILLSAKLISCKILKIEDGLIEGSSMKTRSGTKFYAFRKIPFAEQPINALRFKAPVSRKSWNGVIDCKDYGPMCMQKNINSSSEDCLHLNVFTKNLPSDSRKLQLKPVIAYIHGGGFESGSSIEHGPEYLMERDVVLVTINYRLGAFGFMAVGTSDIPGNAGLKDQVLALRWIQQNIHYFGGDSSKVTIAGLSAGGYSVTGHMISPMSQGLFHNVIAMSGALTWQKGLKMDNLNVVKALADKIQCTSDNVDIMVQCLKETAAADIAANMIFPFFGCPLIRWLPVIEDDFGQERYLTDEPNVLFHDGKFQKVNVMIGITADEFIYPAAYILNDSNLTKALNEEFDDIAPSCFFFDPKNSTKMAGSLRKAYLPYDTIDIRALNNLNQLFADGVIGYGVHRFVKYVSRFTDVYYYKFSFVGRFSLFKYPRDKPYGVHHADDIQYVFNASYVGPSITLSDPESIMVERMTKIWEQFVATGNPNNSTDRYLKEMVWSQHDVARENYLDIGTHLIEKNGLYLERYKVWDDLENSCLGVKANSFLIFMFFLKSFVKIL